MLRSCHLYYTVVDGRGLARMNYSEKQGGRRASRQTHTLQGRLTRTYLAGRQAACARPRPRPRHSIHCRCVALTALRLCSYSHAAACCQCFCTVRAAFDIAAAPPWSSVRCSAMATLLLVSPTDVVAIMRMAC